VGIEKGFYEAEGVRVEFLGDTLGGPTAIQAVASGRAEAGLSSWFAIINAASAGLPIKGITDIQSATKNQPLEEFFVRADSGIVTAQDLKGKKIAVNLWKSSFHYTWIMYLESNGMAENDVEFILMPFSDQATALDAGAVDAIGLMQPYTNMADNVFSGKFSRLYTALDVFGEKQFSVHFINSVWANAYPEQAAAFKRGTLKSIRYIEANQDEAKPIIAKCTGVDVQYIPDYFFQADGLASSLDAQYWIDYMRKRGDLKNDWLTLDDVLQK